MKTDQDIRNAIEWNRYHFSFNDSLIMKPIFEYELVSDGFGCKIKFSWPVSLVVPPGDEPWNEDDSYPDIDSDTINYTWQDQTNYASFWTQIEGIFEQIVTAHRNIEKQL